MDLTYPNQLRDGKTGHTMQVHTVQCSLGSDIVRCAKRHSEM